MYIVKFYCEKCDSHHVLELEYLGESANYLCPNCKNPNTFVQNIEVDFEYNKEPLKFGRNGRPKAWG